MQNVIFGNGQVAPHRRLAAHKQVRVQPFMNVHVHLFINDRTFISTHSALSESVYKHPGG